MLILLIFAAAVTGLRLSLYRITTGSMRPDIPTGSLIVVSKLVAPRLNHAITFAVDGHVVTHVLVGYNPDGSLITRGTANPSNDVWPRPVYGQDVQGSVVLRFIGFSPDFRRSDRGLMAAGGIGVMTPASLLYVSRNRHASRRSVMLQSNL